MRYLGWEVFWILGSVYGFWEVSWILESVAPMGDRIGPQCFLMLQSIPWDVVTSDACINTSLDMFLDTLFSAIDQHIPRIKLKRRSRPPWINKM